MADSGNRGPGLLRYLAVLLIRGRDARFIRADLEDAFASDRARGMAGFRAHRRYAVNVVTSAFSLLRARFHRPVVGVSRLDVKLGLRMLHRQPGLTVVALLALAIGIPVGLAPMHAAIAFEAPPRVEEGERIQALRYYNTVTSRWARVSAYDFTVWREELRTFETLGATTRGVSHNLSTEYGRASPVRGAEVTASTFEILRVPALLGRTLTAADEAAGAPSVVVISYDLWQSRMAGAADVLGRIIRVDGIQREVVGVMPDDFHFPVGDQVWLPLRLHAVTDDHDAGDYTIFGRLAGGVSAGEAEAELRTVAGRLAAANPRMHERLRPEVVAFTTGLFGLPRGGLDDSIEFYFFQVLALLVLTVACVNIGMLFLARTASRSGEVAVRTALGASRARVVSQLFIESLVLAVLAAGAGLVAGDMVANRAFGWLVDEIPNWIDLGVTPRTVIFALGLAVFSAAIVGVIPALKVTGGSVQHNIQRASANRSGVRFGGVSSALIVIDVALAVATLALAVGTSGRLMQTRNGMGIQPDRYLAAAVALSGSEPGVQAGDTDLAAFMARAAATQRELVRRIAEQPDVQAVAVAEALPGMQHEAARVEVEGQMLSAGSSGSPFVRVARVDIGYFDAFEQPILSGRDFDPNDIGVDASAIIVNTTFVERVLGGRNPIGQRVRYIPRNAQEPGPWFEIVGVVGHLGLNEIAPALDQGIYHPLPPGALAAEARARGEAVTRHPLRLAIRTDTDAESFVPRLRALTNEVDAAAIVEGAQRLDEIFNFDAYTIGWIRLGALVFVGILLAMSAAGTYALMSFTVSQRTREIGIRTALGERRGSLILTIARRSIAQLAVGGLLGMAIGGFLLGAISSELRRPVSGPLVITLAVGGTVMLIVGLLACLAPTRRALRILPAEALRS